MEKAGIILFLKVLSGNEKWHFFAHFFSLERDLAQPEGGVALIMTQAPTIDTPVRLALAHSVCDLWVTFSYFLNNFSLLPTQNDQAIDTLPSTWFIKANNWSMEKGFPPRFDLQEQIGK